MKKLTIIISMFLFVTAFSVKAQEMTQKEKNNYAIGVLLGEKIKEEIQKSGMDMSIFETIKEKMNAVLPFESIVEKIDFHSIKEGFSDIFKGECKLPKEVIEASLTDLHNSIESVKKIFEELQNSENENSSSGKTDYFHVLSNRLGSLSWYYLFIQDYKQAEKSALQALKYDHTQTWVKVNLAHALLLQNRFSKAEKIYKELSQTIDKDNETYTRVLLKDFDDLEKAGVIPEKHKADVEKIRKMLRYGI